MPRYCTPNVTKTNVFNKQTHLLTFRCKTKTVRRVNSGCVQALNTFSIKYTALSLHKLDWKIILHHWNFSNIYSISSSTVPLYYYLQICDAKRLDKMNKRTNEEKEKKLKPMISSFFAFYMIRQLDLQCAMCNNTSTYGYFFISIFEWCRMVHSQMYKH